MVEDDPGIARKVRTIAKLNEMGIPTLDWLPHIAEAETQIRPAREVAERAVALCAVAVHAEMHHSGKTEPFAWRLLESVGLVPALSPEERRFFDTPHPPEQDIVQFSWRYESCAMLLWALRLLPEIPYPSDICDVPIVARLTRQLAEEGLDSAQLRPASEILDELDFIFRLHWAVRDAELNDKEVPGDLEPGVVMERHHALNWLTDGDNVSWDNTNTGT